MRIQQIGFKELPRGLYPNHVDKELTKYFHENVFIFLNKKTMAFENYEYNLEITNNKYKIDIEDEGIFEGELSDIVEEIIFLSDYLPNRQVGLKLYIEGYIIYTIYNENMLGLLGAEILNKLLEGVVITEVDKSILTRWVDTKNCILVENVSSRTTGIAVAKKYKLPVICSWEKSRTIESGISKIKYLRDARGTTHLKWLLKGIDTYIGEHNGVYYSFDGRWKSKSYEEAVEKNKEYIGRYGEYYDIQYR